MLSTFPAIAARESARVTDVWPSWPHFGEDEIEAVTAVLRSGRVNYWTGDEGRQFEAEFAAFVGCQHAIALSNGTAALELALRALQVGVGDEVITTSRTFIGTASSVIAVGATPIFADIDADSQNVFAASIRAVITPRTKAIIAVHLAGWPCDMDPILDLAREFGLRVIEDCAQAHGATYKGRKVGSLGDVGAFSFCQDKIITTAGEGGMVTTNDDVLWRWMWAYKDHGKSYSAVYEREHGPGYRWLHESFGTNWRLSEVQSAVGRIALQRLPQWLAIRRQHAARLGASLSEHMALRIPKSPLEISHAYYKFYAFVRPEQLLNGWTRDGIAEAITSHGVPCTTGSCSEVYLEKAFAIGLRPQNGLAIARQLGATSLMLQVHPTLEDRHIGHACSVIAKVMLDATAH